MWISAAKNTNNINTALVIKDSNVQTFQCCNEESQIGERLTQMSQGKYVLVDSESSSESLLNIF